jgi:hypothetical protein
LFPEKAGAIVPVEDVKNVKQDDDEETSSGDDDFTDDSEDSEMSEDSDEETSSGADLSGDSEDETDDSEEQTAPKVCMPCPSCLLQSCLALFILCLLYCSLKLLARREQLKL